MTPDHPSFFSSWPYVIDEPLFFHADKFLNWVAWSFFNLIIMQRAGQ